jgi:predicted enzyme related to lactoylglutathione lyase
MAQASKGDFVWYDHMAKDPKAAMAFYGSVVGWKTQPFAEGSHYVMWVGSQGPLGGVMELPKEMAAMGVPPHWMGNVMVDDVDKAVELVTKLGGKVHKAAEDIPGVGRFAVIGDPQGASISLFKSKESMALHEPKAGEIVWNELITSNMEAAYKFYSELFGWKTIQDMDMGPMGTYRIYGIGDKQLGGMMTAPKNMPMPPSWLFYAGTDDLEAAIARATERGAKVVTGPMDVPDGGRIAQLMDPQGAAFALHQKKK